MTERRPLITINAAQGLLARVAARDEDAVAEFYHTYADAVFRFIRRRINAPREDAEELTLDTFLSAIQLARTFEGRSSVFVWLCGIAKMRIARYVRDHSRLKQIPPNRLIYHDEETLRLFQEAAMSVDFPQEILERVEAQQLVRVMMNSLSEDEREALLLHYVEQMSIAEIAEMLHRSEKGVRNLLSRAKHKALQRAEAWRQRQAYE
ncbi:MAG: RNA polymerase sigma factor [Abditibacteriales bacterium]|nr:RNA polymerase sigma factor [Abditibacteriales bacterium]MDW8365566.1 RNA polymerase sigma factor [Abditibacteriales bacterium]